MDSVAVNTTQNVVIDYQPAGLGNRILAGLLDMIFKWAYILTMVIVLLATNVFDSRSTTGTVTIIFILAVPYVFYDLLFEIFAQGQSLGKKIMKIKVVKLDGTQPSVGSFLLRWLIRFFEIDLMSGVVAFVSIAASKNKQRLGDMAAGTTVIIVRPAVTLRDTILQAEQKTGYKISFPQVANLTEKDMEIMKEVYDFYMKTGKTEGLAKLAGKVKTKAGIQTNMRDGELISTLMKDYNHYKFEE
ncbi:MAG: RDD family protein [Bacteroidia bacterium]